MGNSPDCSRTGGLFDINMIFLLVTTVFTLGRTWTDVFILTVNCRDWMKWERLSPTDRILTLQGAIRICLGYLSLIWCILYKFFRAILHIGYVYKMFTFSFSFFTSCNVWLTASLCSYYCVKVADFGHPFFILLKLRLSSGLVSTWLLGFAILLFAISLPFAFSDLEMQAYQNCSNFFPNPNVTGSYKVMAVYQQYVLLGLGYCMPFSICATSAVLLLFSLWRHHQRMLGSWEGYRSPQTYAHLQAVIIIVSLLVNHVVLFVSNLYVSYEGLRGNVIARYSASVVQYICFSVESVISIWGNKKLKNGLCRSLYFAKCRGYVC